MDMPGGQWESISLKYKMNLIFHTSVLFWTQFFPSLEKCPALRAGGALITLYLYDQLHHVLEYQNLSIRHFLGGFSLLIAVGT